MYITSWGDAFIASFQSFKWALASFIPQLVFAIILFVIGWILAHYVGKAIKALVDSLKLDTMFRSTGLEKNLERAGMHLSVGGFIGGLFRWIIIIGFFIASMQFLGLTEVTSFLNSALIPYLLQVLVAALLLAVASVIAEGARKLVIASASGANIGSAKALGSVAFYAIWIFAIFFALSGLGIAQQYMGTLFTGIVFMLALAGGLAFGLGGKEAAARTIENIKGSMKQ